MWMTLFCINCGGAFYFLLGILLNWMDHKRRAISNRAWTGKWILFFGTTIYWTGTGNMTGKTGSLSILTKPHNAHFHMALCDEAERRYLAANT